MRMKGHKHRARTVSFATWNVCTLMESAWGDRRICRSRQRSGPSPQTPANSTSPHCVDRKLDFLVKEMKRRSVAVAGIQETKWFGKDIWNADGYTLLHSGRSRPDEGEPQVWNEGVGILLGKYATVAWKYATVAWKDAGENWETISSRVAMARLEVVYKLAQDRKEWAAIYKQCHTSDREFCAANSSNSDGLYLCPCGRSFRRQGDLTWHSRFCDGSPQPSHRQTVSTFQYLCGRTFRRHGDLTRHSRFCNTT